MVSNESVPEGNTSIKTYILREPQSGKEYKVKDHGDRIEIEKDDQPTVWIFKHRIEVSTSYGPQVLQRNKAVDFRKSVRSYIKKELKHGKSKNV